MSALQKIDYTEKDISEREVVDLLNEKFDRIHKEHRELKSLLKSKDREISTLHLALDASRERISDFSDHIETRGNEYLDLMNKYKEQGMWIDWYLMLMQFGLIFMFICGFASLIGVFFL